MRRGEDRGEKVMLMTCTYEIVSISNQRCQVYFSSGGWSGERGHDDQCVMGCFVFTNQMCVGFVKREVMFRLRGKCNVTCFLYAFNFLFFKSI